MAELILARHGETVWNVEKLYRGRTDVNLDEVGIKQAKLLGKYLSIWELEVIYSSPLRRAIETANIIARYQKIVVKIAEGLTDFDYGEWQSLQSKSEGHSCVSSGTTSGIPEEILIRLLNHENRHNW